LKPSPGAAEQIRLRCPREAVLTIDFPPCSARFARFLPSVVAPGNPPGRDLRRALLSVALSVPAASCSGFGGRLCRLRAHT
jgi:hypothetical protein